MTSRLPARSRSAINPDVIVVGSINVDFVVTVTKLPRAGQTVTGGRFARHFGGKGGNQAVAAARLGATVRMVGAVGDDDIGQAALADLGAEGIDLAGVSVLPGTSTGLALIVVDERGENQIAVASGANAELSGAMVEMALAGVTGDAVMVIGFEVGDDAVSAAASVAVARAWRVVANPAPVRPFPAQLRAADPLVVANELEAAALGARPAIITLGASGAEVNEGGHAIRVLAPTVEVVDTTGAGDTFVGVLAAELAGGANVVEAARTAVLAASLSVTKAGARAGMPNRAEVARQRANS